MDDIDRAQLENERHLRRSLQAQQQEAANALKSTGRCLYCDESIVDKNKTRRWCDIGCRDGYQKYEDAQRRTWTK